MNKNWPNDKITERNFPKRKTRKEQLAGLKEKGSSARTHTAHLAPRVNTHAAYLNQRAESPSEKSKGDGP